MKFCPFARSRLSRSISALGLGVTAALVAMPAAHASSHREAPFISAT